MSKPLTPEDLEALKPDWLQAYEIPASLDRSIWADKFKRALGRLHYFQVTKVETHMGNDPMIEILGRFNTNLRMAQMVQVDVEGLWNTQVAGDLQAFHAVEPTDSGFNFRFLVAAGEGYGISGVLHVVSGR